MNIDQASGRSLDALVARNVFGLLVEPMTNAKTREPDPVCRLPSGDWVTVPYYSSLVLGADEVVAKLQNLGWRVMSERRGDLRGAPPDLQIMLAHSDGRMVKAYGRSFSQALCRAALKAVTLSIMFTAIFYTPAIQDAVVGNTRMTIPGIGTCACAWGHGRAPWPLVRLDRRLTRAPA